MPCCVFRKCHTYTGTAVKSMPDVSFHLFPKDGLIKEKWVHVVRTQRRDDEWMPSTSSTICSKHFVESDKYLTKKNVRKLIKEAVPVIKHNENLGEGKESHDDSLKDEVKSDHDSIFDSPGKAYLKKKIIKINEEKKRLQEKNYNLTKQNKRLREKCENLQKLLSKLKKKIID